MPIGSGVHPCHSLVLAVGVKKSVGHQLQVGVMIALHVHHYVLDKLAVLLEASFFSFLLGILLQSPYCPQRHIGLVDLCNMYGDRLALHELVITLHSGLHHQLEVIVFLDGECQTRQRDERVAGTALEPRITGNDVSVVVAFATMELMGSIDQTMEEIIAWRTLIHFLVEECLQTARFDFGCGSGKDDGLTLLDVHLEIAGNIEVLIGSIAALLLLGILHTTIPVGLEDEIILLGELHEQVGITGIHTCLDAIVDLSIIS